MTQHRFDKLARKAAKDLWSNVRTALAFLENKLAKSYPYELLVKQLEEAEELARDALRVIAEKLHVFPALLRERSKSERSAATPSTQRTMLFDLGVMLSTRASPSRSREGDRGGGHHSQPQSADVINEIAALTPDPSPAIGRGERNPQSSLQRRTEALEDVLANPGKHAARMKRAIYQQDNETEEVRLIVKSDTDLIFAHVLRTMAEPSYYGTPEYERLHAKMLEGG